MYREQNPLSAYSRNPNQPDIPDRNKPQRSISTHIKTQINPSPGPVDLIIKFIAYALLIAGILALIALVGSNVFKGAQAFSLEDNQWRSVEHNGVEISVEGLLKARRMLVEDPLMRDFSNCKECVAYFDLKYNLDNSARAAENYVMIKVADATRVKIEGTEHAQLAAMENFVNKTSKIPWLKEKLEQLLSLNKTFSTTLAEAVESERVVQALRTRYEIKSRNIEDLSNKAKKNLQEADGFTAKIETIKTKLQKAETSIIDNINGLKTERGLVEGRIEEMRNKIKELLQEARAPSASELADVIALKTSAIEAQKKVKEVCEKKIELHGEEISKLNTRRTEAYKSLGDIELRLSRWHWVKHVLETIKKFEDIREQVKQLQISQLADGKKNIDRLLRSLTVKETQFAEDKRDFEGGRVSFTRVEKKVTVDDSGNTVIESRQTSNSAAANLETQQDLIEQEQAYLKTWSREQFKTLNLSTHEIRNLTETIDNLSARIKNAGEYEKYTDLKALTEKEIEITIARLGELETELKACENLIGDNSKTIEAQNDLKKLERIRSDIRDLENEMSAEEIQLQEKDAALRKERQEISGKRKNAAEDIEQAEKRLRSLREALRGLVKSINDRIVDPPRMDEVKNYIEKYQMMVKKSNDEFQNLLDLMNEIRKIIC